MRQGSRGPPHLVDRVDALLRRDLRDRMTGILVIACDSQCGGGVFDKSFFSRYARGSGADEQRVDVELMRWSADRTQAWKLKDGNKVAVFSHDKAAAIAQQIGLPVPA